MTSPVVIHCRGVELSIARDVLHKSPVLLNAAEGSEEAVELDRDPAAVRMVVEYCTTGIITHEMQTEAFFIEADFFGVAPEVSLLNTVREATSLEKMQYDAGLFIERMIYTNMQSPIGKATYDSFYSSKSKGFIDPTFSLVVM
jgi:hypothetical protein